MNRRKFFLSLAGGAALGWIGWKSSSQGPTPELKHKFLEGMVKLARSQRAFGTDVSITVFHPNKRQAEKAIQRAFKEIELVEDLMSIYHPESQLSQLNRDKTVSQPHPYLVEVLKTATDLSKETNGAFDITVQPLYQLYAQSADSNHRPDPGRIKSVLEQVNWRKLEVSSQQIRLYGEHSAITLNGIAQGYAADLVAMRLRQSGIEHALINSGEIGTIGKHIEDRDWSIGIKHPRNKNNVLGVTELKGRCLATSGDYETRFGAGFEHHHLLDPRTGASANELSSVSIAAPTALMADALSTAVFVMGLQRGKELLRTIPNVDALFITKQGHIHQTNHFPFIT